jgi:hypothetical protein
MRQSYFGCMVCVLCGLSSWCFCCRTWLCSRCSYTGVSGRKTSKDEIVSEIDARGEDGRIIFSYFLEVRHGDTVPLV